MDDYPYWNMEGEPCSRDEWLELWRDQKARIVAQDYVGDYFVSTVWLGIDHGFGASGKPVLWETMVFRGDASDLDCWRYVSREEAVDGHARMLEQVRLTVEWGTEVEGSVLNVNDEGE